MNTSQPVGFTPDPSFDSIATPRLALSDESIRQAVHERQVRLLFKSLRVGLVVGTAAFVILLAPMTLLGRLPFVIRLWAAFMILSIVAGYVLHLSYQRANPDASQLGPWRNTFVGGAAVNGLGWSAIGFCVLAPEVRMFEPLLVSAVCLLAVGATSGYAVYLPAMFAFVAGVTIPMATAFAIQGDAVHIAMAVFFLMSVCAILVFGIEFNRTLSAEIALSLRVSALAQELDREKEQVIAASRARSRFLASASHDLRQPVHSINLYVSALSGHVDDQRGIAVLDRLSRSVRALDGLFDGIQDIAKFDAGVITVSRRRFPLQRAFDALEGQFRAAADSKDLALVFDGGQHVIESDPVLLGRMLNNLVANAVRYTSRGRIDVSASPAGDGTFIAIRVMDTGAGIPAERLDDIFEEFVQLHNPERDREKGLGLGLAIVRKLSVLLDHPVRVQSKPGRGSTFSICVPAASLPQSDMTSQSVPRLVTPVQPIAGLFVLVIDDNRDVLDATETVLLQAGCHVLTATSGDDAVMLVGREDRFPDAIVSDLRLRDGENGIQAIARVRQAVGLAIPAVLVTGDTSPERIAEAANSGFPLLHKPLTAERLQSAIKDLMLPPLTNSTATSS